MKKKILFIALFTVTCSFTFAALPPASDLNNDSPIIGKGRATTFAHGSAIDGCKADLQDQLHNNQPASFTKFKKYLSKAGEKAIPGVALRKGKMGSVVEVRLNDKCKAFPLMDRGPGNPDAEIDLTGSAYDVLLGIKPCRTIGNLGKLKKSIPVVEFAIDPNQKRFISPGGYGECVLLAKPKNNIVAPSTQV